jgi:hypothetical protein
MQNGQMKGQVGHSLPLPGLSGTANGPVGKFFLLRPHPPCITQNQVTYASFLQVTSSRVPSTTMAT